MNIQIAAKKFYAYSKHFRNYSDETIRRYRQTINNYTRHIGIVDTTEMNEENARAFFYHGRIDRNWKSATHIVFHHSLKVFVDWCIKEKYVEGVNFMKNLDLPKMEQVAIPKLTLQQAEKLLDVALNHPFEYSDKFIRCRNHAIFATFLFTGIRKSELLNLKYSDIDLENLSLFVNQGKGKKDRTIPIDFTLAEILSNYLKERKKLKRTCPHFFVSSNRNTGFTKSGLKRIVLKFREASGIYFTIHQLRHTYATLMMVGGCDLISLQIMMGHSNINTTRKYLDATIEHLRSQTSKHPLSGSFAINH